MRNMRDETTGQQSVSARKVGLVDQPSEQQGSVGVRGQRDGVQDDTCRDPFLSSGIARSVLHSRTFWYSDV